MNNLSTKVNEVFEGEEGIWTEVVKRQVNKSLESVSENIEEVHKVKRGQKQKGKEIEAEEQRDRKIEETRNVGQCPT